MRITDETIAGLCIKYLAWDEPVGKRDIELVRPMFERVAELTRRETLGELEHRCPHQKIPALAKRECGCCWGELKREWGFVNLSDVDRHIKERGV